MKRIVLFVEGVGEAQSAPALVGRLWAERTDATSVGFVDSNPFIVGNVIKVINRKDDWIRHLRAAAKRSSLGGVLVVLDADVWEDEGGCAVEAARKLVEAARDAGAGSQFSIAVVLMRKEFESILIASYSSLPGSRPNVSLPSDIEVAPRDAKRWLKQDLNGGYKEATDQVELTKSIDIDVVRGAKLRSFRRLESAVDGLFDAITSGRPSATP